MTDVLTKEMIETYIPFTPELKISLIEALQIAVTPETGDDPDAALVTRMVEAFTWLLGDVTGHGPAGGVVIDQHGRYWLEGRPLSRDARNLIRMARDEMLPPCIEDF